MLDPKAAAPPGAEYLNYFRYAEHMTTRTFPYSAFLRGPSQVLPSLENADVVLERRDDDNLVLMRAERFEAALITVRTAARALALLAQRDIDLAESLLREQLPWLHWLPENERQSCVTDLLGHLAAGAETGHFLPFSHAFCAWQSTAEAWSDPELVDALTGPHIGEGPEVPRPLPDAS